LIRYHLCGSIGWQRIFGNDRGTDVQPIQLIKTAKFYGLTFSHGGLSPIPSGNIFICKNIPPTNDIETIKRNAIGIITLSQNLDGPISFIMEPGDVLSLPMIDWVQSDLVGSKGDKISIYADNLVGVTLELYMAYH